MTLGIYLHTFRAAVCFVILVTAAGCGSGPGATSSATTSPTRSTPTIIWSAPVPIVYGTALSATQLNATASVAGSPVAGTFTYSPALGFVPGAGTQTLNVSFTPSDTADYYSTQSSVALVVSKATPTISWAPPPPVVYGTALGATQLNATASVPGSFTYSPAIGSVPAAGTQILNVSFTPTDTTDYTSARTSVPLVVTTTGIPTPTISWAAPAAIVYGTALSAAQLNATASVAGSFTYSPAIGSVLHAGTQTLTVTFTPTDTVGHNSAQSSVSLVVTKATPALHWATPAAIVHGTALTAAQLNATASAAGSFTYSPALGSVLNAGTQTLSVSFTPTDATDYTSAQAHVSLVVTNGTSTTRTTPTIKWTAPHAIVYGTALSAAQLNATASVAGSFTYSPALGAVLAAGTHTLNVSFTPTDTADYNAASSSVSLVVAKATPAISWAAPASIASGSTLSAAQLDATSAVSGSFVYTPAAGTTETIPGSLTLQAVFTPTDTADYLVSTVTNTLTVTPAATPTYSWTSVTINAGGFTDGLYFHPKQQGLLYAKMDIADAYRFNTTTNRWVSLLDWIDRQQGNYFGTDEYAVGSLALDPTDPNKLYLAVGIGTGSQPGNLLISQNQGSTFTNVQLPFTVRSNANGREGGERMAVDPNLPSRLYFGTVNDGLWYSDNGGLTWTQSSTFPALGTANAQGISFVLPVATSGTAGSLTPLIFAGVAESTSAGALNTLYVSTNAGTTWTPVRGQISGSLLPIRGRLGPSHELYVTYDNAIGPDGITQGMICAYTYTDAGVISAPRNITPNLLAAGETAGYVDIEPDPSTPGALLTASIDGSLTINGVGQDYIYRSVDDGNTWISFANDTHDITPTPWLAADMRNHDSNWINLAVDPFNPKHVLYGTGSMIFATNDITVAGGAVAWYEQAVGDEEHNVVALAAPPTGPTILYSGLHDHNGMAHTSLTAAPPRYPNANTNMASSIAYAENNPLIVARVGGNKNFTATAGPYGAYSDDGGTTWTTFANTPLPASATGDGSIAVSADGSTLVWAPYDVPPVYSTDQGQTWTLSAGAPSPSKKVVADHLNTNVFYMSSMTYGSYPPSNTGGALYMSTDKGRTFHPVAGTSALPAGDVYANFALAGDVWLASPSGGLYRNTGTPTAIVMSKVGVFSYAYHMAFGAPKPGSGYHYTVYVDGNIDGVDGVYRSTDGGASWLLINDQQHQYGYLNVLEADRRTFGTVYLGPGGRGIIWGTSSN